MYDDIIYIHEPIKSYPNAVEVSTLSTIPEHLQGAITVENQHLLLDNVCGKNIVPMGSVIQYRKSDKTESGYDCRFIGFAGTDLVKVDGVFQTKKMPLHAYLIPSHEEDIPVWVKDCNITYNGDGTATLKTSSGNFTGRIGVDFIATKNGKNGARIITRDDEDYDSLIVCDEWKNDIGKLSELYPA